MEKLNILIKRLKKIGIDMELFRNSPWIYIDTINGKRVTEQFHGNHGFTIAFTPSKNEELNFTDIPEIFKVIRQYSGRQKQSA